MDLCLSYEGSVFILWAIVSNVFVFILHVWAIVPNEFVFILWAIVSNGFVFILWAIVPNWSVFILWAIVPNTSVFILWAICLHVDRWMIDLEGGWWLSHSLLQSTGTAGAVRERNLSSLHFFSHPRKKNTVLFLLAFAEMCTLDQWNLCLNWHALGMKFSVGIEGV